MKKRLISFLLVFAMVLTMLPMTALAASADGDLVQRTRRQVRLYRCFGE